MKDETMREQINKHLPGLGDWLHTRLKEIVDAPKISGGLATTANEARSLDDQLTKCRWEENNGVWNLIC